MSPKYAKTISMTGAVRQFFTDNPDEELTPPQVRAKFNLSQSQFYEVMKTLAAEGLLESVHVVRNRRMGIAA